MINNVAIAVVTIVCFTVLYLQAHFDDRRNDLVERKSIGHVFVHPNRNMIYSYIIFGLCLIILVASNV